MSPAAADRREFVVMPAGADRVISRRSSARRRMPAASRTSPATRDRAAVRADVAGIRGFSATRTARGGPAAARPSYRYPARECRRCIRVASSGA
jgi:hypothetical protein